MESQAYFTGIRQQIIDRLAGAKDTVLVAVAWLTDRELFDGLVACQRRGVTVSLAVLDDRLNRKSSIAWERLTALGGKLYWIPEGTNRAGSLHHKFCLIDNDTVINGSFNWTNRASSADENIIVMQGDASFAEQFRQAFAQLLEKHGHDVEPVAIDRAKLAARLAVLGKLLELEDFEDIPPQLQKIEHAKSLPEIAYLISQLNQRDWQGALTAINDLLVRGVAIAIYQDPRIKSWQWQVRLMESQVMTLEAELADMHRQIHIFDYQQEQAIGDLIRDYLDIKRRVLKAQSKKDQSVDHRAQAQAAEDTYEQYEKARAAKADETKPEQLAPQQQADLKLLYRRLAQRCHPDKMKDSDKAWATDVFKKLQTAFQNNDLQTLQGLKSQIEKGPGADFEWLVPDQADQLEARLAELHRALAQLNQQLASIMQSATWQTLSTETDWQSWFERKAEQLRQEIQRYQAELDQTQVLEEAQ